MNHKPWLRRKRSMEKTIFTMDTVVSHSRIIEEEAHTLPTNKETGLERSSKEKLATVIIDSHAWDDPLASAETVIPTEETLQEPLKPLSCVEEEQEQKLSGPILKISKDHEKMHRELEEKLRETSKRIDDLTSENTHLTNALMAKEKTIGDLVRRKQEADAESSTLMARLDSTEKENAFLSYEFHMQEKELEIRKEEMDYIGQYAEASHKQYLECSQKASKLEAECQRLRLLLQKRPPGPAGLNVKNKVGMMRQETDMRRRKSNPTRDLIYRNSYIGNSAQVSEKTISLMIKRLHGQDEENKALKRILNQKNTELDSSRLMYAETASRLSQAEILLRKFSENQKSMQLARCYPTSNELPLIPNFDISSDDEALSSGSWANALISELERLRTTEAKNHPNNRAIEVPDMSFMDDFVDMEKRAIVSVDTPKIGYCSDTSGRELVPVEQDLGLSGRKQDIQFKHTTTENSFDWLQVVLNAVLEEKRISKRSLNELIDDIKIAFGCINHPAACRSDAIQKSRHPGESDSFNLSGFAEAKSNQQFNSSLREPVHRIIKLVEGIAPESFTCNNSPDCLEENRHSDISQSPSSTEYFVHVFQWKVSHLNPLLHQFVHTCKQLLTGKADLGNFVEEVAFALDWSISNCVTNANASIARDKIRKHFSCHRSQSENENQIDVEDTQSFHAPSIAYPDDRSNSEFLNTTYNQCDLLEEIGILKDDLRNACIVKKDLEVKFLSVTNESQNLAKQCQEAQNTIKGLESEIETLKESIAVNEDQIEKQKMINEDLDTQLRIAQSKLNDIFQKFSSLEVELEDKKNSCEELEATCLELQLQLESIAKKESPTYGKYEVEKIYKTGWEITTASSKLAECQETILNLGKQLKALASSNEAEPFDWVVSTTSTKAIPTQKNNLIKRTSLRNQMQAEDDAKAGIHKNVQNEESAQRPPPHFESENRTATQAPSIKVNASETNLTSEQNDRSKAAGALAIVPSKKQGGFDFLRKLLLRRKKGRGKATRLVAKKHDQEGK